MTAAKKLGRPPLPKGERMVSIVVRLLQVDLDEIDAAAERLGISRSELIRSAVRAKARRVRR